MARQPNPTQPRLQTPLPAGAVGLRVHAWANAWPLTGLVNQAPGEGGGGSCNTVCSWSDKIINDVAWPPSRTPAQPVCATLKWVPALRVPRKHHTAPPDAAPSHCRLQRHTWQQPSLVRLLWPPAGVQVTSQPHTGHRACALLLAAARVCVCVRACARAQAHAPPVACGGVSEALSVASKHQPAARGVALLAT